MIVLVNYHGRDLSISLQELHNLGLVGGLHTGKQPGPAGGTGLFLNGQVIKLTSCEGHALC